MKVVHVAQWYAPHGGGVESHLLGLNRQLLDRGYQVSVLTTQHDVSLPLEDQLEGVRIYRMPVRFEDFVSKTLYKVRLWTEVARRSKVLLEADRIQVHDVLWWLVLLLPLIGHKTYIVFHGWEGKYPVPAWIKIQRWIWSIMAKGRINVGTYLQEFYWEKPDRVFYGAVDPRFFTTPPAIKKNQTPHIVYIGRLVAENELEKYIALVKELRHRIPKLRVTWVGDGPFKDECARVGSTPGFVSDVLPYLDDADVVLATSYLSTMQAQARGKIVCSLYSHPLKEATLRTFPTAKSMLINDDVDQMATQIESLLFDSSTKELFGKSAQRWARTQTWQSIADEYEKLWGTYG